MNTGKPHRQKLECSKYSVGTSIVKRKVRQENKHSVVSTVIGRGVGGDSAQGARTVNQGGCKRMWRAQEKFPSRVNI